MLGARRFGKVKVLIKVSQRLLVGKVSMRIFMGILFIVLMIGTARIILNDAITV